MRYQKGVRLPVKNKTTCRCCVVSMFMAFVIFVGGCSAAIFGVDRMMVNRLGFGLVDSVRVFRGIRWVDSDRLPPEHTAKDEYTFFRNLEQGLFLNEYTNLSADKIMEYLNIETGEQEVDGYVRPVATIAPRNSADNIVVDGGENLFENIFKRENIDFERLDLFCPYLHDEGQYLMNLSGNEFASFGNALLQSLLRSVELPSLFPANTDMTIRAITFGKEAEDGIVTASVQFSLDAQELARGILDNIGVSGFGGAIRALLPEELLLNATIGLNGDFATVLSAGTMSQRQITSFYRVIDGILALTGENSTTQDLLDELGVRFIAPVTALVGNFIDADSYYNGRVDFDPIEMMLFLSGINEGDEDDVTSRSLLWGLRDMSVTNAQRWTEIEPMTVTEDRVLAEINDKYFRTEQANITSLASLFGGDVRFDPNDFDAVRRATDTRTPEQLRPFVRDDELHLYVMSRLSLAAYGGYNVGNILSIEIREVNIDEDDFFAICLIIEYQTDAILGTYQFGGAVFSDFVDRVIVRSTTYIGIRGDDIDDDEQRAFYFTKVTINEMDVDEDGNITDSTYQRDNFKTLIGRFGGTFDFEQRAYDTGRMIFDHFSADSISDNNIRQNVNFDFAMRYVDGQKRGGMLLANIYDWSKGVVG
ncbi:MAG: hypothetical protein FWC80_01050 [Firmicutes bacterium]|nr:hypothetical protein [Bacillota bacterium]